MSRKSKVKIFKIFLVIIIAIILIGAIIYLFPLFQNLSTEKRSIRV